LPHSEFDMTASTVWENAGPLSVRPATGRARRHVLAAARRHSRLVRWLRIVLPLGSAAIGGFVLVAAHFGLPGAIDLSAARLTVTRNAIIMEQPRVTGFDRDQREYSVAADRAIQPLTSPDEVRLEAIQAELMAAGQGGTKISAEAADYDHSDRKLLLHGAIVVNSASGYELSMTEALVDFAAGTMATPNPTTVRYQDSEVSAQSMSVSDGGELIVFEGQVRTLLMPPKSETGSSAPGAE
jgi:lipopolysaccharide export system protein LptC